MIKIKSFLKKILIKLGINAQIISSNKDLSLLVARFKENYKPLNLIRIGAMSDGGYLVPNILDNIKYCFSAGIGNISSFEKELSKKYLIKSFMSDGSINEPPEVDENFFFIKKFISSRTKDEYITLSDWLINSIGKDKKTNDNKILQMDIEGSEYEVLTYESAETLGLFSIIIIEFHELQNLANRNFLKMFSGNLEKIYKYFSICHVHPNNNCGVIKIGGIEVPGAIEVTFVRNDLIKKENLLSEIVLPHQLDCKTIKNIKEIKMPEIWWKK